MLDKIILIMARKNSKRISDKNMKYFLGVPLIQHTFETAKKLDIPVIVSTDHERIKLLCEAWYPKFTVIDQPAEIQEENGNCNQSMKWVLSKIPAKIVILMQPTSPIRDWANVQNWISEFEKSDCDSGFSVYPFEKYIYDDNGNSLTGNNRSINNQKKPVCYVENGSVFIFRAEKLENNHIVFGKKMLFLDNYHFDLDSEDEWTEAENKCRQK